MHYINNGSAILGFLYSLCNKYRMTKEGKFYLLETSCSNKGNDSQTNGAGAPTTEIPMISHRKGHLATCLPIRDDRKYQGFPVPRQHPHSNSYQTKMNIYNFDEGKL